MSTEIVLLEGENIVNKLASSFPENEQKEIARDMFLAMNMKTTGTGDEKIKYNAYQALSYVVACKNLGLNPVMNHVIMLEDQFYITLQGHLQNAHASGQLVGLSTELISSEEVNVKAKEWKQAPSGKKYAEIIDVKAKQFRYKCTIKKSINGSISEFTAEGVADYTNVTGGEKKSELAIEQMAEARAMRRCLSRAFPVGLGNFEDIQDAKEYESTHPTKELLLNDKFNSTE